MLMTNTLSSKSSYRQFASLFCPIFFPIAARNIINSSVSIVDVLMLGRLSETALSGSSFATQFNLIVMLAIGGLSSGMSIMIAQYWAIIMDIPPFSS